MVAVAACSDSISVSASGVEVRGCDFGYFPKRAIFTRHSATGIYIHDCSFHNNVNGKGSDSNAHEAIALGYSNLYSRTSMKGASDQQQILEPERRGRGRQREDLGQSCPRKPAFE